jgi:hypothetical protein
MEKVKETLEKSNLVFRERDTLAMLATKRVNWSK